MTKLSTKMTKTEIYDVYCANGLKLHFDEKLSKIKLIEKFNNLIQNPKTENIVKNENENENDIVKQTFNDYIAFLFENELQYNVENNQIIVSAIKKHIFVEISQINEKLNIHVYTILNKKMTDDMNESKKHARNILNLKSIKALKSYTISNSK